METRNINPILSRGASLETPRLILRPWKHSDLDDFYEYAKDPQVGPRAGWKVHESREITKKVLDYFMDSNKVFALEEKASGKLVGSLGVDQLLSPLKEYFVGYDGRELGYVLARPYWNRGYMSEVVALLRDVLFQVYGLDYLVCGHFEDNLASRAVILKTGFRYIGTMDFVDQADKAHKTLIYYQWNPDMLDPFKGIEDLFEVRTSG